jgi:hypothetical protein
MGAKQMIITQPKVSEHWYTRSGDPMYTVLGSNGKMRSTTLRDARSRNLVPSVTTILNVAAKPALQIWMQRQVLMSALTLPRVEGESDDSYIDRVLTDSKELGKSAAAHGTDIHESIEDYYSGKKPTNHLAHVDACAQALNDWIGNQNWIAERSFGHDLGFGGKVDLHCETAIVDVKTKEFGPNDKVEGYDEHLMQLAAYRVGLGIEGAACANLFVSRTNPGVVFLKHWTEKEIENGWQMFKRLLEFWQLKNGHK